MRAITIRRIVKFNISLESQILPLIKRIDIKHYTIPENVKVKLPTFKEREIFAVLMRFNLMINENNRRSS